ncbi:MAG: YbhB/YbcL family Raf kinase inhibitor-like protein [Minicystis sp.]
MKRGVFLVPVVLGFGWLAACSSETNASSSGASSSSTTVASSSAASSGAGGAGTGGAAMGGSGGSGGQASFALTSTGYTEGSAIPAKYTCAGANASPDLKWTTGPAAAKSYAVVLTDKTINLVHWVIWDIPGATHALPEGVQKVANPPAPAGAKQVKSYDNSTFGYLGPCPPNQHTYELAVFALDVATLPSVTTASTRKDVVTEIQSHDLASATLTGTYAP